MALCLLITALALGCDAKPPNSNESANPAEKSQTPQRIVCLVPAITQMIVDLGLEDHLMGVGQPDPAAPDGVPRVGNYLNVDAEALLTKDPDLVITLRSKDSPSARLQRLADRGRFHLAAFPYPDRIEDVLATLAGSPSKQSREDSQTFTPLGKLLAKTKEADRLRRQIERKLQALNDRYAKQPRSKVLLCIGTSPVMASGSGTVHGQLLNLINAENAAAGANVTAPTYDRESLVALSPDVIVLFKPAGPPLADDDPRLADFRGLPVPAVENHRIKLINDPKCQLPSTNLPKIAEELGNAVHGASAEEKR